MLQLLIGDQMYTAPKTSVSAIAAFPEPDGSLLYPGKYGGFRASDYAYIIHDLATPRPWVNVMANPSYGLVVSHTGGGFSWLENSQLFRLNRWEQDLATDEYGRFVYLSDGEELWSTSFAPTRVHADQEEVVHGLGWSEFNRSYRGIDSRHKLTVDETLPFEIHLLTLTNTNSYAVDLTLGTYIDWHIGSVGDWHREFHRLFTSVEAFENYAIAYKRAGLIEHERTPTNDSPAAYSAVFSSAPSQWFTDKQNWIGKLRTTAQPEAMIAPVSPVSTGRWDDPIAASRTKIKLAAGEAIEVAWVIGVEPSADQVKERVASLNFEKLIHRFEAARTANIDRAQSLKIQTSDDNCNLLVNGWLPHQAEIGRMIARSAYYQQGGAYGFRDQLQDSLCLLDTKPNRTIQQIELNASQTYEDGGVRHWWHPKTQIFAESRHSDTCLWVTFALLEYLDETGDFSALNRSSEFLSRQTQAAAGERTLLEQCLAGIERTLSLRSSRGLPLIGAGDWNDGLSHAGIDGKGESVWVAMFLHAILLRFVPVLESLGKSELADRYRNAMEELRGAVNEHAWDGEWYVAGYSDNGQPFGSHTRPEGKIFLNAQTWAVISQIAPADRAQIALESVRNRLLKPYGALLLWPAFKDVDPYVGYITRYAPGLRENGGVYSHAATWAVQAFEMAGDLETAYEVFQSLCPPLRAQIDSDQYAAEPYVMPGNSDGPDSPHEGKGGWTWYTGSASWMRRVFLRHILGVRATSAGLRVTSHLPEGISGYRLERPFRGDTFALEIERAVPGADQVLPSSGTGAYHSIKLPS